MNKPLYRTEALEHHRNRSQGEVLLMGSPKSTWLVAGAAIMALSLIGFAIFGHYTRKERVVGYLMPTQGIIKVQATQPGTVAEKHVVEGDEVKRGDVLMTVVADRSTSNMLGAHAAVTTQLKLRRDSLRVEQSKQAKIDELTTLGVEERIVGLEVEIEQTREQLELQESRIVSAEKTLARYEQLLHDRFVSEVTAQQKREELLDRRNQATQLRRSLTELARGLNAAKLERDASALRRGNNNAVFARQISELEQQLTEADTRFNSVLTAPVDGVVTTILTGTGQPVSTGVPVLTILPKGASLEAQLLVPTRAAGFLKRDQAVSLRFQAFPYQRFGHQNGNVAEIGRSVMLPNEANLPIAVREPVYRVTVHLPRQNVQAYGQQLPLQPGMLVDADIHVDRRRLIEWIIDPIVSVTGRL